MLAVIGRGILWVVSPLVGKKTWDALFLWLLGQAPRIWGGKYQTRMHGAKSRAWAYAKWQEQNARAVTTKQLWDDSACAWVDGYHDFKWERLAVEEQLKELLEEMTGDRILKARQRLSKLLQDLRES